MPRANKQLFTSIRQTVSDLELIINQTRCKDWRIWRGWRPSRAYSAPSRAMRWIKSDRSAIHQHLWWRKWQSRWCFLSTSQNIPSISLQRYATTWGLHIIFHPLTLARYLYYRRNHRRVWPSMGITVNENYGCFPTSCISRLKLTYLWFGCYNIGHWLMSLWVAYLARLYINNEHSRKHHIHTPNAMHMWST